MQKAYPSADQAERCPDISEQRALVRQHGAIERELIAQIEIGIHPELSQMHEGVRPEFARHWLDHPEDLNDRIGRLRHKVSLPPDIDDDLAGYIHLMASSDQLFAASVGVPSLARISLSRNG